MADREPQVGDRVRVRQYSPSLWRGTTGIVDTVSTDRIYRFDVRLDATDGWLRSFAADELEIVGAGGEGDGE